MKRTVINPSAADGPGTAFNAGMGPSGNQQMGGSAPNSKPQDGGGTGGGAPSGSAIDIGGRQGIVHDLTNLG